DLDDWYPGTRPDDACQFAAVRRIEMDHDNECGAGSLRQRPEEALQRMDAACGSPDENDHRLSIVVALVSEFVPIGVVVIVVGHGKYSALPPHLNTPENHSILQPLSQQFRAYEAAARPGFGTAGRCRGAPMPKRSVLTRPMERIAADPERAVQEAPEHRVPPAQWNFQAAAHLTLGAIVPAARRGSLRISVGRLVRLWDRCFRSPAAAEAS